MVQEPLHLPEEQAAWVYPAVAWVAHMDAQGRAGAGITRASLLLIVVLTLREHHDQGALVVGVWVAV